MRIISNLGTAEYGVKDFYSRYEVNVDEDKQNISIHFTSLDRPRMGGHIEITKKAAIQLAHALLLASSGPLKELSFAVDENSSGKTSVARH